MSSAPQTCLVMTTLPIEQHAETWAKNLIEARLAACVQILPPMRSVYPWQNQVQVSSEQILFIKTSRSSYPQLTAWIHEHHPYEIPEVLLFEADQVVEPYERWLLNTLTPQN